MGAPNTVPVVIGRRPAPSTGRRRLPRLWWAERSDPTTSGGATGGRRVPTRPSTESFWLTWVEGTGLQTLDWEAASGDLTAVITNADASAGVTAELAFGAAPTVDIDAIRRSSLIAGAILLIGGGLLLYIVIRRRGSNSPSPPDDPGHEESAMQAASTEDPPLPHLVPHVGDHLAVTPPERTAEGD
jgi:hypothetical protein